MDQVQVSKKELNPIFDRIHRANQLASYAKKNGWSEEETKSAVELLHSILKEGGSSHENHGEKTS